MSNCTILFDQNEHGTYFTGQVVTGKVIFDFNKPKKLKGIKLQICGYAACQWRQKHGRARPQTKIKRRRKHVFTGREDYISSTTFLVGSDIGSQIQMEAGIHTYTFACPIPINCPSSYEGTYGHIRYIAKVTTMKHCSTNRTHAVGFTVLKLLDLNQESRLLKSPCNNEALENFCLFHTKAVHLTINIQQSGYVPGQIMMVNANINNESSVNCQKLLILLNLRATYTSDTPYMRTTSEKICLVKKPLGPCPRQSKKSYSDSIRIPATPPTCEHLSKCVRVSYEVCVVAVMNHFMRNPKAVLPITIGNVPLAASPSVRIDDVPTTSSCAMQIAGGTEHNLLSDSVQAIEETEGEDNDDEEDFEHVYAEEVQNQRTIMELPPPTYEEAMYMTRNIADNDDSENVNEAARFTPRYPVYNVDIINTITPPPNPPQKRRRKKKQPAPQIDEKEKPPVESPVQI